MKNYQGLKQTTFFRVSYSYIHTHMHKTATHTPIYTIMRIYAHVVFFPCTENKRKKKSYFLTFFYLCAFLSIPKTIVAVAAVGAVILRYFTHSTVLCITIRNPSIGTYVKLKQAVEFQEKKKTENGKPNVKTRRYFFPTHFKKRRRKDTNNSNCSNENDGRVCGE